MAGIAGWAGQFVIVDDYGRVFHTDNQTNKTRVELFEKEKRLEVLDGLPPYSVACSDTAGLAKCVISDAIGNAWANRENNLKKFHKVEDVKSRRRSPGTSSVD